METMENKKYADKAGLAAFYQGQVDRLSVEIRQMKKNNVTYIMAELFSFGLAIVAAVVYCVRDMQGQWLVAALAMLAVYAVVRKADVKNVCEGTPIGYTADYYRDRLPLTGDVHGQAPVLWCAYALLADEL